MVAGLLAAAHPDHTFAPEVIRTEGDADQTSPLTQIGGRGVFTSALQEKLAAGEIDLAVHSAKDVPSLEPSGLRLAAFPDREDPRDALISRHGVGLDGLPPNPVIGTSSRRRAVQILAIRPDAVIRELRGNIDTRLRKAQAGEYDAIVLAVAGVTRMGWTDAITEPLAIERFTPAPAQGAIAVETRNDDVFELVHAIDVSAVSAAVGIERAFLRGVGGGCTTPIGAHAVIDGDEATLFAMLCDDDGTRLVREKVRLLLHEQVETDAFHIARRMQRELQPLFTPGRVAESLEGKTVLVTGSPSHAASLTSTLESLKANVVILETFRILPPEVEPDAVTVGPCDWVVITSANAFPHADNAAKLLITGGAKLAVVGKRTAGAARKHGLQPDLVGGSDGAALAEELIRHGVAGKRMVMLVSDLAAGTLPDLLRDAGANVDVVTAYHNVAHDGMSDEIATLIANGGIDIVTFSSPSAVRGFAKVASRYLAAMSGASFVALGATTVDAMHEHGLPVHELADRPDVAGLVAAILRSTGRDTGAFA
jgi:hydroxymethylbilane synthase